MSIGTDIIQNALRRIGAFSIAMPSEPETIVESMGTLNSMLQLWRSWGIFQDLVPLEEPGDELYEPIDATNAITDNLALLLAPNFDNGGGQGVVSQQLKNNARLGLHQIKTLYQTFDVPDATPSSTLPKGSGNSQGDWRDDVFFDGEQLDG